MPQGKSQFNNKPAVGDLAFTTFAMQRFAFTLIEVVIALATSMILVVGLVSSLYISSQALKENENASQQTRTAAVVLHDLATDLNRAIVFSERTTTELTFNVPDRDGDTEPETIRYAWSGTAGDPLTYQYNGGPIVNIATDVQSFNITALPRELLANTAMVVPVEGGVVYEGVSDPPTKLGGTISIPIPENTSDGDLLIAAVATYGNTLATLESDANWSLVKKDSSGSYAGPTFGVWWKIASSSEPSNHQFTGISNKQAYGWIMRFTGHDSDNPIHKSNSTKGTAPPYSIPSPAVVTTVDNALILRLGAFATGLAPTINYPGLAGHESITIGSSAPFGLAVSGGAGYLNQTAADDSGTSLFSILPGGASKGFTSVTIAIAPEENP